MDNEKFFNMSFARVYSLLIAKAEKKGRTAEDVYYLTSWLTGYKSSDIDYAMSDNVSYGEFFKNAPVINPNREKITGSICGVKISEITDPLMKDIRCLDKLVDELSKGKPIDKIIKYLEEDDKE